MFAEQDASNNEINPRTQTDSIHERFRSVDHYVYCEDCKGKIEPNKAAIQKHYKNKSHPSSNICRYCKGNVFIYRDIVNADDRLNHTYTFHKCKHKYDSEEESIADESS